MPVDTKFIGREYGPVDYHIGEEKIKEYIQAIGDLNPLYIDKGVDTISHPMFVVIYSREILVQLFSDKELNLDYPRLLHGEQEFTFQKIVKANDSIKTIGKIKNIYQKSNNDFVELETKSYNQNNDLVVEGLWTFIIRGQ